MKKLVVILSSIIGLVLVVVIGIVAYVLTFDPNENKELITNKFQQATGRTLTLDGPITLSIYPWLGLTADQISISNAEGFSDTPLLRADHIAARVKLLPLLSRSLEIDTVRLDGLALNLEVRGDGRNNWTFGEPAAPDAQAASPDAGSSGGGINDFILGGVDIRNTSLVFDDQFAAKHYEVNNLNMQVGELVYGQPLNITMNLDAASSAPQLTAALEMNGVVLYDLDNERYDLNPLALTATLRGPAVPSGSADLTLNTALSADLGADTLALSQLELDALGSRLSATAEVRELTSDAPAVDAKLSVDGDDLSVLLRVLGQNDLAQRVASLDRSFNVESSLAADLDAGTLSVPALSAKLLGASIDGKIDAQRFNTETPAFNGEFKASGPDLPLLLQVAGQLQGGQNALSEYGQQLRSVRDRSFSVTTNFTGDLDRGDINVPMLDAALLGFTLKGQLDAKDMNGGGDVAGRLDLRGDNLREVLTAIGQQDLAQSAQSLTLQAVVNGSGDSFDISPLDLALVVNGPQVGNQPQTLGLKADTNVNLDDDRLTVDTFTVSGLGLDLNGKVQVDSFSGEQLAYTGELQLPEFDARRLMTQLNLPLDTADDAVLQRVGFTGAFKGTGNSFALNDFDLRLDDSQLTGMVDLRDLSTMAGSFKLDVDTIDVDRYLAPPSESAATTTAPGATGDEPLPVDALKSLNVQGEIGVGQLAISGLRMQDILVRLAAANGDVALNPINATLYEGKFAGNIHLNVAGAEPTASVDTTLTDINLAPLLQDFMDATYLSGKGTVQLALTGRGASVNAIKRNLNGSGSINLADGVLSGIDVGDTLARVETMIRNKQLMQLSQQGGQTPFETFAATLAVENGVVSTNDLTIAAPQWGITGTGTLANLNDDTINFNLVTLMNEGTLDANGTEYQVGGHALPIACTGSLASPRCLPDVQAIFTAAVGNALQDRIGNLLRDRLGGGQQQQAAPPAEGTAPAPQDAPAPSDPAAEPAPQQEQKPESTEDRVKGLLRGVFQ
jgi:AsmA protein